MLSRAVLSCLAATAVAACSAEWGRRAPLDSLEPVANDDGTLVYRVGFYARSDHNAGIDICLPELTQCNRVVRTDEANTVAARWLGPRVLAVVVTGPVVESYVSRGRIGELQYSTALTECFPGSLFGISSANECSARELDILCSDPVFWTTYIQGEVSYNTFRGRSPPAGSRRICPEEASAPVTESEAR